MNPAVFLDRDGVLNAVVWRDGEPGSPRVAAEFLVDAEVAAPLERLQQAGFRLFVVTNQPDVSRGRLERDVLDGFMERVREAFPVDDVRVCPHDDGDGCACRKPRPGMLLELAARWDVDLAGSWMVGDGWRDVAAGRAAGCRTLLLRRGYNGDVRADHEADTLAEAVDVILSGNGRGPAPRGYAGRFLDEAARILAGLDAAALDRMAEVLAELREEGGRLFLVGVGGGAAHASHAAADFRKIAGIEAYAVADNVAELTARTNDEGWATVFAEYLRGSRLGRADGVFVFSVGGGDAERNISANLVQALGLARERGARVFGVVGRDGGHTARVADHCVVVPVVNEATVTPHTESFQALVWHLLVSHPALQRHAMKWESVSRNAPAPEPQPAPDSGEAHVLPPAPAAAHARAPGPGAARESEPRREQDDVSTRS